MNTVELYLAPLRGFTDHTFRRVYTAHFDGFDAAVAPFVSSKKDHKFKKKYIKDILPENNTCLPVVPQILGNSAKDFIALANFIFEWGHTTVNWNLGCPYPMVARKGRGSGMLPDTEKIETFIEEVVLKIKGKLSIKIRLGWETAEDIFRLTHILNRYPLAELIIHPRTGIQRYEGCVDLKSFEKCTMELQHPIVYNGDIKTAADLFSLKKRFPVVNRWMIGRGCLSNPFLPMQLKDPEAKIIDKTAKMKAFHDDLFKGYLEILDGPSHVLNKMKGFWQYFAVPFEKNKKELKAIKKAQTPERYISSVNALMQNEGQWG